MEEFIGRWRADGIQGQKPLWAERLQAAGARQSTYTVHSDGQDIASRVTPPTAKCTTHPLVRAVGFRGFNSSQSIKPQPFQHSMIPSHSSEGLTPDGSRSLPLYQSILQFKVFTDEIPGRCSRLYAMYNDQHHFYRNRIQNQPSSLARSSLLV